MGILIITFVLSLTMGCAVFGVYTFRKVDDDNSLRKRFIAYNEEKDCGRASYHLS